MQDMTCLLKNSQKFYYSFYGHICSFWMMEIWPSKTMTAVWSRSSYHYHSFWRSNFHHSKWADMTIEAIVIFWEFSRKHVMTCMSKTRGWPNYKIIYNSWLLCPKNMKKIPPKSLGLAFVAQNVSILLILWDPTRSATAHDVAPGLLWPHGNSVTNFRPQLFRS